VTQLEAGQICLLASLLGEPGQIFIPRFDPQSQLQLLERLAVGVLAHHGLQAVTFSDEMEARQEVAQLSSQGRWPLLLTPLDTSGEKPYEEFVGTGEQVQDVGLSSLLAVRHSSAPVGQDVIVALERMARDPSLVTTKSDIAAVIARAIPTFTHAETGKDLDQRM